MTAKIELVNEEGKVLFETHSSHWLQARILGPLESASLTYLGDDYMQSDPKKPEEAPFHVFQLNLGADAEARLYKLRSNGEPTEVVLGAGKSALFPGAVTDVYTFRATYRED